MAERPGLWGHADFMRLWSAQAISAFGSRITRTALPIIAVKALGEPETIVGLLTALQLAPGVVLASFAGGFVDRSHKRRILIGSDLVRAAVVASLTIAWAVGALSMVHLIAVGAVVGAASALFQITDIAFLPTLINKTLLAEGNSKLEATEGIAEITGPASAGVLIAALGAPLAVAVDAASYLWSALMLGRIRTREVAAPPIAQPLAQSSMWQTTMDLRVGMRAVWGNLHVRPIACAQIVWSISYGFFAALYTLFCLRTLQLPESTFGVIIAMGGIGSLGGALIARRLARVFGLGRTLFVAAVLTVLGGVLIPLAGGSRFAAIGFLGAHQLLSDACSVVFVIHAVTLRQTVLPKHVLGRANAAIHILSAGLVPIAAIGAGVLAQLTSIRLAVWVGTVVALVGPVFLLPLRKLRELPPAA